MRCSSPIYQEILEVMVRAKSPFSSVSTITRRVSITRHDSRVHGALQDMEDAGLVTFDCQGWSLTDAGAEAHRELALEAA